MIQLKNVTIKYPNGFHAVTDFNLEIKSGEIVTFLGPSGCGKTSTLRLIAGLEKITKGEIFIDGKDVTFAPPKDRGVSMVFQNYAIFPHMNVYDNIAFGLKPHDISDEEIRKRVDAIAHQLDIAFLYERMPRQLSAGQRQRTALARAFIADTKVMLLDEPFSNLDAKQREYMIIEVKKLLQRFNKSAIYVTHNQNEAMSIADRIVIMRDGVITQVDTPENLYYRPCNLFVASFMGSPMMNTWEASLATENSEVFASCGQNRLKLPPTKAAAVENYIGKKVVVGVRPEDMHVATTGLQQPEINAMDATVAISMFYGRERRLHCTINGADFEISITAPAKYAAKAGDRLKVMISPENIYLFDNDTELAIN